MATSKIVQTFICLVLILPYHNGKANAGRRTVRIVGGYEARLGDFPYVGALIEIKNASFSIEKCTFSLITTETALSAGHCAYQKDGVSIYNVAQVCGVLGVIDRKKYSNCYKFAKIIPHPGYSLQNAKDDISIFIFNKEIETSKFIKPIPLLGESMKIGEEVTVVGFGTLSPEVKPGSNSILHYIKLTVAKPEFCRIDSEEKQYCLETTDEGFCTGDSGGPNVVTRSGKVVQVGISVFAEMDCALYYSGSTLVSGYQDWIKAHAEGTLEFITH